MNNKLFLNTAASFIFFSINIIIYLVVSPIIIEYVGGDAYGYVKIANDFANYATVITIALNSVAARFISICYHQGSIKEANIYFNSVFWMNILISTTLLLVGMIVILFLEYLINIPLHLLLDVKALFSLIFINFALSVVSTIITVGVFIKNMLYISNVINATASILKIAVIFLLFHFCSPQLWILGVANVVFTVFVCVVNDFFRKKIISELQVNIKFFSLKHVLNMLKTGIWSSISSISQIFSDGLDLLVTNIFISETSMGQLAIAKTVSSLMSLLISNLTSLFNPNLTYYYAKNMKSKVISEFMLSMKFTAFISSIPVCIFTVVGTNFFRLWIPSQDSKQIFILAELCIMSVAVSGVTSALNNVFILTNHLKINSIVWLLVSFFDIFVVFLLLKISSLGIYAVAGVSSIVGMIVNLTYLPCIAGKYLNCNSILFYKVIFRYMVCFFVGLSISIFLNNLMSFPITWGYLILKCIILGIILVVIELFVLLNKAERRKFGNVLFSLVKKQNIKKV